MGNPILYIVIPCYNEEAVLPLTSGMFLKKSKTLPQRARYRTKAAYCSSTTVPRIRPGTSSEAWLKRTSITGAFAFPATAAIRTLCWRA